MRLCDKVDGLLENYVDVQLHRFSMAAHWISEEKNRRKKNIDKLWIWNRLITMQKRMHAIY